MNVLESEFTQPQYRTRVVRTPVSKGGSVKLAIESVVEEVPPPMFPDFNDPSMDFDRDYM